MASVFIENPWDIAEFSFPLLVRHRENTQGMRNFYNFQEQWLIKPQALSDKYFYSRKRTPKHNTFHLKQAGQTNHRWACITFHKQHNVIFAKLLHACILKAVQQSSSKSWTILTGSVPAVACRCPSIAHPCKGEGAQNRKPPQNKHEHPTGPAIQCGTFLHFSQDTYEVGQSIVRVRGVPTLPRPSKAGCRGWCQSGGWEDAVCADPWSGRATARPLLP